MDNLISLTIVSIADSILIGNEVEKMAKGKIVHTCYGCKYYYRISEQGENQYGKPFSTRHCDIEYSMECDYVLNGGEPNVIAESMKGEKE